MNILLITTLYPGYEGQSRLEVSYAIHQFVNEWKEEGHNIKVIRLWSKFPFVFNLTNRGKITTKYRNDQNVTIDGVEVNIITVNRLPKVDYFMFHKNKALKKIINSTENFRPDIIVCHMMNPSLYISTKLKEKWNVPLILTIHQTDIKQIKSNKRRYNEYLALLPFVERLGFRSSALMDQYGQLNLPNKNNFIVNSGINEDLIIDEEMINKKSQSNQNMIFVASNMIPRKNIDVLIKAFEKVAMKENVYLKIAGNGPDKDKLLSIINDSKVKNKIKYLGYLSRKEVLSQMENSNIFVLVSSHETFGLVYLEAMAKGCITVGSKGEGVDGIIENNINGYLSEPKNIEDLVETISKIINLGNPDKTKIIKNAVNTAKNMTQKTMSNKYLAELNSAIDKFKK